MNQDQYLQDAVLSFRDWLATRLCGEKVDFAIPHHDIRYDTLTAAFHAYRWPLKATAGLPRPDVPSPYVHPMVPTLSAMSTFADNEVVLGAIQQALRIAYRAGTTPNDCLAGAVASLFHWGGVYTTTKGGGNRPWLATNHLALRSILQLVVTDHARGDDWSKVSSLRFNSGMTKVYSLLIDDFIIYDSRVAAALAWLALHWWTKEGHGDKQELPSNLRFGCPPANGKAAAFRNPAQTIFRSLSNRPYEHYQWNVRANWLLGSAQAMAGERSRFANLRQIEAALFQMGNRVI